MLSRNLLSIESGPASRMASKPILGWGWCAMQKAWLMKPNQFPGFKSRHHAGSFSIHRYKWNTGFARFHRKYLLKTFFKHFFLPILCLRNVLTKSHFWKLVLWRTLDGEQANGVRVGVLRGCLHALSMVMADRKKPGGDTLWSEDHGDDDGTNCGDFQH